MTSESIYCGMNSCLVSSISELPNPAPMFFFFNQGNLEGELTIESLIGMEYSLAA